MPCLLMHVYVRCHTNKRERHGVEALLAMLRGPSDEANTTTGRMNAVRIHVDKEGGTVTCRATRVFENRVACWVWAPPLEGGRLVEVKKKCTGAKG